MLKIVTTLKELLCEEKDALKIDDLIKLCVKENNIDLLLFLDEQTNEYNKNIAGVILNVYNTNRTQKFINKYKITHLQEIIEEYVTNSNGSLLRYLLADSK